MASSKYVFKGALKKKEQPFAPPAQLQTSYSQSSSFSRPVVTARKNQLDSPSSSEDAIRRENQRYVVASSSSSEEDEDHDQTRKRPLQKKMAPPIEPHEDDILQQPEKEEEDQVLGKKRKKAAANKPFYQELQDDDEDEEGEELVPSTSSRRAAYKRLPELDFVLSFAHERARELLENRSPDDQALKICVATWLHDVETRFSNFQVYAQRHDDLECALVNSQNSQKKLRRDASDRRERERRLRIRLEELQAIEERYRQGSLDQAHSVELLERILQ